MLPASACQGATLALQEELGYHPRIAGNEDGGPAILH